MPRLARCLLALPLAALLGAASPGQVRVRLVTSEGPITLALDARRAPKTTANFLLYVDDGRFDGTQFYRSARSKVDPRRGFIQGGIDTDARRTLAPVPLERTDRTGIRHLDATVSMARTSDPDSARGNFVLTVGPTPQMDARGDYPGYAAFGRVIGGMAVVRRILAMPTGGGSGPTRGQMLFKPVALIRAERLDGTPRPSGQVKPWLIGLRPRAAPPR
jgi:peptidyl-prolyl cis-trans isomerase A (cyclophilin A)